MTRKNAGYKVLAQEKFNDIKQTEEELRYFKDLYSRELLTDRNAGQTYAIIKNLEVLLETDKAQYHRLKAVSINS